MQKGKKTGSAGREGRAIQVPANAGTESALTLFDQGGR
jgi:hypothetical protein